MLLQKKKMVGDAMNYVQPIRDRAKLEAMKVYLKENYGDKYRFLFVFGIYSALRISDILSLKVKDVRDATHLIVKEAKTGNERRIKINSILRGEINQYSKDLRDHDYLFAGAKTKEPFSRQWSHKVLKESAKAVGIKERISTHSLRKTFGWHMYQQTKDVALLQEIFGHAAPSITLRYIGVTDDIIDVAMDNFAI
jgi:integrase